MAVNWSKAAPSSAGKASLESIIITEQLSLRSPGAPKHQEENLALQEISNLLGLSTEQALQGLADQAMKLCLSDSAGISLLEVEDGKEAFRWKAVSGSLKSFSNGLMPRDFSPSSVVCSSSKSVLMKKWNEYYQYANKLKSEFHELLLVPIYLNEKPIGTVWALSHGSHKEFTSEDERILKYIATFVSGVVQNGHKLNELENEKQLIELFISTVSHDLRTPLAAAKMKAQLISKKVDEPIKKLSDRIAANMDRADNMIRDLLDSSKIKAGEKIILDIKSINLNDTAKTTIEDLIIIHGARLDFLASESIEGNFDEEAIKRILENLVNNAIKYGDTEKNITLKLEREENRVSFSVHNFGNPIDEEEKEKLFKQYKRGSNALLSNRQGWGIGLMLVKGLVESMNGKVNVASSEKEGTTFTVQLPLIARV